MNAIISCSPWIILDENQDSYFDTRTLVHMHKKKEKELWFIQTMKKK